MLLSCLACAHPAAIGVRSQNTDEITDMEFRRVLALRGPNVWASFPVLEAWLDLGGLKDSASNEMPGFNERLASWLPTLIEHRCSVGERGGFFERLRRGTYLAHILEHVALELQSLAGHEAGFGRTRQANEDGVYKVVVRYREEEVGRACLEAARQLCLAAVHDHSFDVSAEVEKLRALVAQTSLGASAAAIVEAARKHNIPVRRLGPEGLVQLGHGVRQRRILANLIDAPKALAETVACDHELTRNLLYVAGVPITEGRPVVDAEDAWAAACEIIGQEKGGTAPLPPPGQEKGGGAPLPPPGSASLGEHRTVVVRPRYANHRRGISWGLTTREQVLAAYERARKEGPAVLVERSIPGADWRLLVVGDRVVAVVRRDKEGSVEATDQLHPRVAGQAIAAAEAVGLEVAGVDVVAEDIGRPLEEQGGAVVGVQARPGLALHLKPTSGSPRPIGEAIVAHQFPDGHAGRIPIVAITGANGKTTTTRLTAHLLAQAGYCVGMTCTEGIFIGGRRIASGDCSGPTSAGWVLQNTRTEAAVLETARGGIVRAGLAFDRCDVAIVTNIGEGDHLGTSDIDTLEGLSYVKSTVVAAVSNTGSAVLRADDPHVVSMAQYCRGAVVYFCRDEFHEEMVRHRGTGGSAVFDRDGNIILARGEEETVLASLERVPLTHGGRVGFHVLNVLAATAAAWSLGVSPETIRAGLASFAAGMDMVPGRFNLLQINGGAVVVDYGHNVSALEALVDALSHLPQRWRSIVFSGSGDRRDVDLVRQGEILGNAFDRVTLYEDPGYLRGRQEGMLTALFRQGLTAGKRVKEVREVRSWKKAVEEALSSLRPGELLVIQPDLIDETVELIRHYVASEGGREIDLTVAMRPSESTNEEGSGGVEVRSSNLGRGVFALRAFDKGQTVLRGWGRSVPSRVRESIQVDVDVHVIPTAPMLYLNHSCEPNCGLLIDREAEEMQVEALRRIEPGEEVRLDYSTFEYEIAGYDGRCLCGAPSCRGRIIGYKNLPEALREAYGPYLAPHLREAEAAEREKEKAPVGV